MAELDHENSVLIRRDELRKLEDKAAKADQLLDEISNLVTQKRAQDARLVELQTLQETKVENNRLVEENAHLKEELEIHRTSSLRVDKLEKENERLAAELKQTLDRARDNETRARLAGSDIPVSVEPASSILRTESDQSGAAAKRTYESLVRKYNKLYENHADIASAREQLQKALNAKKESMREYQEYYNHLERKIKRKDTRIEEQNEELRQLRVQIRDVDSESRVSQGFERTPKIDSRHEREAQNLKEVATALNAASSGPINYGGKIVTFDDIVKALDSPILNEIVITASRIRAPTSSPVRLGFTNGDRRFRLFSSPLGSGSASELLQESKAFRKNQDDGNLVDPLPKLFFGGDNASDESVVETEFDALEPGHTSSTNGVIQNISPEKSSNREIKEELLTDSPTSPETPVVISSKSVRKRHYRNKENQPNDSPKVKIETISSSPIGLAAIYGLDESIDLDDIGEKQPTPRKGRPLLQRVLRTGSSLAKSASVESRTEDQSHSNHSNDSVQALQTTPIHKTGVSRARSALQPRSSNTQILPRTSTERAPKRRRIASDKAVEDLIGDGQIVQSVEKSPANTLTEQARRLEDLLAKASPPKQVLRSPAMQSKLRHSGEGASVVPSRANEFPQDDALPRPTSRGAFRDSAYFSRPVSRGSPVGANPSREPPKTEALRPPSRDSFQKLERLERLMLNHPQSATPARNRKQPLRTRPLDHFTLQDFKVNPKYNQGYDYAFSDVVRNQADRRCLQGCTKPECCGGKFRALAEATRNPNLPLTLSQEEADDTMLKEFLGGNSYKLRNMTKNEREEILIQARARDMSNKYGKHRHAYERRTSPPGYWRSDFPNTQEEMEDRAKAQQLERDQIAQRYEAAMRPGGAYIFRDE